MPDNKKRCVIITPFLARPLGEAYAFDEGDFIITVDGGYAVATGAGFLPDLALGDFDSFPIERLSGFPAGRICRSPAEKDDTDVMLAIKKGLDLGFSDFYIVGGTGGRLDHTVANLQAMAYCLSQGASVWLSDGQNKATMSDAGEIRLPRQHGCCFSLFSWGGPCAGVCVINAKYPLNGAVLTDSFPLGVSNEFLEGDAVIRKSSGRLLIIITRD